MRNTLTFLLLLVLLPICGQKTSNQINLAGEWKFAIDPQDKGIQESWFSRTLSDKLILPGSMTSNDKGDEVGLGTPWTGQIVDSSYFKKPEYAKYRVSGNIKIPFWLQSVKYYKGAAWYQKEIVIPANWDGKSIILQLERCHWESRLWVDDKESGMQNSLGTPHQYNLTSVLTPGKHRLTICVDNRTKTIDPGYNSHSISDHTQTNWNGIVGHISLEAHPSVMIRNIQIYPDIKNRKFTAVVKVINGNTSSKKVDLALTIDGLRGSKVEKYDLKAGENTLTVDYSLAKNMKLWSEFHPTLYKLRASVVDKSTNETDSYRTIFGMREISVAGKNLLINGKPLFLRGTLECAIFPKTGYPPTEINEWLRIFRICKAHGLNHMRFHSWCPPHAAFDAADQTGFYLQVECSSWANASTTLGDGKPFDRYLYEESERMVEEYGNHPSFCLMLYGNEPAGDNQTEFLTKFVTHWKSKDSRRIYTSGAGWPNLDVNDYLSSPDPRIQGWGEGLKSIINSQIPRTNYDWTAKISSFNQPVVSHEIGQWCVYPNFKEILKYTGVVRAKNYEIFQETLKDHGMAQLADSFLLASGKLQALCYKADIEAALRTKDFGGFQLLDLHDFPGQGTALVGVLDPFWDEKGYISPKEYSRFCNSTVPLVRMNKFIFNNNETLTAAVEVAHYGDAPLNRCTPKWRLTDISGKMIQSGQFATTDIPLGNCFSLGQLSIPLNNITKAQKIRLEVMVNTFSNSWDIWVYPATNESIAGVEKIKVVSELDAATSQYLENGGSVLLTLKKGTLKPEFGGKVAVGFSSIFWNTAWTNAQAPHTLGILCNPKHAALADFPTEYYSNWQWWDAMSHSNAIDLTTFPKEIKPIVRAIEDWVTNRPLALLFEAKVGKGKLLISGIDFNQNLENRPEARQLLFCLKKYMTGMKFNPSVSVDIRQVKALNNPIN
jgi:hypothetical protein